MASTKNTIVVSASPMGRFLEGIISGTPKPGTIMQIKAATAMVSGKLTWEVYNRDADGNRPQGPIAVLRESQLLGRTVNDAYADGDRAFLYCPIPGDELLVLFANIGTGTGAGQEDLAVGDLLMVDDGTGLVMATSSPECEPFVVIKSETNIVADILIEVMFTGY